MLKLEGKYQIFGRFVRDKARKGSVELLLNATPSKLLLLFPDLLSALFAEVNLEAGLVRCTAYSGPKDLITFTASNELFTFAPDDEYEIVEDRLANLVQGKLNLPGDISIRIVPFESAYQLTAGFFVLIFEGDHPSHEETTGEIGELLDYLSLHIENLCLKSRWKELNTNYDTITKRLSEEKPSSPQEVYSLLENVQESASHIFQTSFSVLFRREGNFLVTVSCRGTCNSFQERHSDDAPFTITLYDSESIPDTQLFDEEFYRSTIEKELMSFIGEDGFDTILVLPVRPFGRYTFIIALVLGPTDPARIDLLKSIAPIYSELASSSIEKRFDRITVSSATSELIQEKKKISNLVHLTNMVTSSLDVHHGLNVAAKKVRELFDADRCSIIIKLPETEEGIIQHSSTRDSTIGERVGIRLREDEYPYLFSTAKSKQPLLIEDIDTLQLNVKERRLFHSLNIQKALLVPVFNHGEFMGILTIEHMNKDKIFTEEDTEFASAIASQISSTISNARLFTNVLKNKNEWELTFNSISEGVFVIDNNYTITNFNKVFVEKLGFDPDKIIGTKCYDLFPCKKADTEECGHIQCIREKKSVETVHEDYEIPGIFRVSISPVFDEQGEVEKSVHFIKDITKEVEYEKKLKESLKNAQDISNYLETLIESSPDSIISTDESGNIVYFSKGASELLGYLPDEICGKHVSEVYPSLEDAKTVGKAMREKDGKVRNYNAYLKKKDGSFVEVLLSVSTLFDENGDRIGTVGISKDLSTIKKMEDYIRQAEKLTALGKLTSGIAHDFNNILAAISMRAELMRLKIEDSALLKELEIIENAAYTGADTVNKLRSFYKRERQAYGPINLNDVIREAIDITAPRWKDMSHSKGINIEITLDLEDTLKTIQGNEGELKDALINLIINAIDAMPKGGKISVQTLNVNNSVKTIFSDSGIGMNPRIRDRAFEPFFSTKGEKGSGLGLSTVYGIITSHGGQVELESFSGKGTSFIIHLPIAEAEAKEVSHDADDLPQDIEGTSVIVFEDEEAIRESIRELLVKAGCKVIGFDNSKEGLAFLEDKLPTIRSESNVAVITDLGMPEINGLEIARKTKEMDNTVPVIMITGWGSFIEPSQVNIYGVDKIIPKPLRGKTLITAIGELTR